MSRVGPILGGDEGGVLPGLRVHQGLAVPDLDQHRRAVVLQKFKAARGGGAAVGQFKDLKGKRSPPALRG